MQVPDRWWNKFKDKKLDEMMRHRTPSKEDRLHLLAALAMCENIDWNVGRVLKKLDQLKVSMIQLLFSFMITDQMEPVGMETWKAGRVQLKKVERDLHCISDGQMA